MKIPLRKLQISWKAGIAVIAASLTLLAVISLALDDPAEAVLQLVLLAGLVVLGLRHSTPNR